MRMHAHRTGTLAKKGEKKIGKRRGMYLSSDKNNKKNSPPRVEVHPKVIPRKRDRVGVSNVEPRRPAPAARIKTIILPPRRVAR